MAMTDDLTGLHNLRSFEAELSRLIHGLQVSGGSMSLMVLDLDRLKSLNDTHGHLTGAEAVRTVGHILATHLPSDAVACRYGGDEFVVAIPHRSEVEAVAVAERLCQAVNHSDPTLAGKHFSAGTLSISVGVAHRTWVARAAGARPRIHDHRERRSEDRAGELLFRAADAALYAAKSRGRNQVFLAASPASNPVATADLGA
jgi:diguanylate cyclase (GGDEF)-like protein